MAEDINESPVESPSSGIVVELNEGIGLSRQHSGTLVKIVCPVGTDQLCGIVNTTENVIKNALDNDAISQENTIVTASAPDISIHATCSAIKSEETLIITSDLSPNDDLLITKNGDLPLSAVVDQHNIEAICKQEISSILNLEPGWQKSAEGPVINVHCKGQKGQLIKARLGSGNRGRCINSEKRWFTPQEFQDFSGLSASKEWKRSIKFQGEPIQTLIDGGFLQPHHYTCVCSICEDNADLENDEDSELSSSKDLLISQFTSALKVPPTPVITTKVVCEPKQQLIIISKDHPEWIKAAQSPVLDIRCKKAKGQLVKARFGSGTRGRCIMYEDKWWTPAEFEALAGRSASKDWKRSIKFYGEPLLVLIESGYLKVHAVSCSCTACLDDDVSNGNVRLFHPYKRKRREIRRGLDDSGSTLNEVKTKILKQEPNSTVPTVTLPVSELGLGGLTVVPNLVLNNGVGLGATVVSTANTQLTTHDSSTSHETNDQSPPQETAPTNSGEQQMSTAPIVSTSLERIPHDLAWEKMNEVLSGLEQQVTMARVMFEHLRQQSKDEAEAAVHSKILDHEKVQVLAQDKLETQNNERFLVEVNEIREEDGSQNMQPIMLDSLISNVPQLEPAALIHGIKKKCVNCNRESDMECSGCRNRAYCGYFCQRRDWADHQNECGRASLPPEDSLNAASNVPGYIFMLAD